MNTELLLLINLAAVVGFTHSLLGPDHSLPIILMAWEKKWTPFKSMVMTFILGTAHVLSAYALALVGIRLGYSLERIQSLQSVTGSLAGWGLIALGFLLAIWGIKRLFKGAYPGYADDNQGNPKVDKRKQLKLNKISTWMLFSLFILGPCELLIPILLIPAAHSGAVVLGGVTLTFFVSTVGTMMALVWVGTKSINALPMRRLESWAPLLAGVGILACGVGVKFMGL